MAGSYFARSQLWTSPTTKAKWPFAAKKPMGILVRKFLRDHLQRLWPLHCHAIDGP